MYPSGNQYDPSSNGNTYGYPRQPMNHLRYDQDQLQPPHTASSLSNAFTDRRYVYTADTEQCQQTHHSVNGNHPNRTMQPHTTSYPPDPSYPPYMRCNVPQSSNTCPPDHYPQQHQCQQSVVDMSQCHFGMNLSAQSQALTTPNTMNTMNSMRNTMGTMHMNNYSDFDGNISDACMMRMNTRNNVNNNTITNTCNDNLRHMNTCNNNSDGVNHDHVQSTNGGNHGFQSHIHSKYNAYDYAQRTMNPEHHFFDCNRCIVPSIPFHMKHHNSNMNNLSMPSSTSSSTISIASEHYNNNNNNNNNTVVKYAPVYSNNNSNNNNNNMYNTNQQSMNVKPQQIVTKTEDITKKHVCSECGKRFRYLSLLDRHVTSHSDEKPFPCDHPGCVKRFQHKYYLNQHKRRTHDAIKKHKCPQCDKAFVEKCNLKIHLRKHTGEKPYQCMLCFRRFSVKTNLDAHVRIHNGDKPFKCETCGKCFARKAYLTQHNRTHTGEKPFECQYCGKRCSQVGDLKKHIRIHTGEKPYQCEICHKKFRYSSHLKSHTRKLHIKQEDSN